MIIENSPVKGIGNDIIEISRMQQAIDRHGSHFLNRLFSEKEQAYCLKYKDPTPHFAGRFAAKESVVKALGVGFGQDLLWHDIEILNDQNGKPYIILDPKLMKRFNNPILMLSISHCELYATAFAIWIA